MRMSCMALYLAVVLPALADVLLKHPEVMERPVVFVGDRAVIARQVDPFPGHRHQPDRVVGPEAVHEPGRRVEHRFFVPLLERK